MNTLSSGMLLLFACVKLPTAAPAPASTVRAEMSTPHVHNGDFGRVLRTWEDERPTRAALDALELDAHDERIRSRARELLHVQGADYASQILRYTDRPHDPDALHRTWQEEVERLNDPLLLERLRTDPATATLEDARRWIAAAGDGPPPCRVQAAPATMVFWAGYHRGTVALQDPVPRWALPFLLAHECEPGHHYHQRRSAEWEDVPLWMRRHTSRAIEEGWATYAESLGEVDPEVLRAMQLWRAARVVVDTGLHTKGWSEAQARAYLTTYTPLPADQIERELQRHLQEPGATLSYALGATEIQAQQERMMGALGERFEPDVFERLVFRPGQSLTGLEADITDWLDRASPPSAE